MADKSSNSNYPPELSLDEMFDNAPIGIFISTPEGRILSANAAMAKMLGYESPEELISSVTDIASQLYDAPAGRTEFQRLLEHYGEVLSHECRLQRRDGKRFWGSMNVSLIRGEAQRIVAYQGFLTDITKRREAAEELKQLEWMLSGNPSLNTDSHPVTQDRAYGDLTLLNRDGIVLGSIGRERLESIADDYLELLGTSSAIYEANGDYALGIFSSGWCRMLDNASRNLCNTSDDVAALNSGRWLCHESCWTHCSKRAVAESAPVDITCSGGIRMYAIPILANGDVVGAMNFGYGNPPTDPEQLRRLAKAYKLDLADLIREAKAYDSRPPFIIELAKRRLHATAQLIGAMIEIKQAEEALQISENRFRHMLDVVPDMISIHSPKMDILYSNWRGFAAVPESIRKIGTKCYNTYRNYADICPDCLARNVLQTRKPLQEERLLPDGTWVDLRVIPLLDKHGQVDRFMEWVRDITEQKHAEAALRESEKKYRTLVDHAQQGVIIAKADPVQLLFANPAMSSISGFEETELLDMDEQQLLVLIHPDDRQRFFGNFKNRVEGKDVPHHSEYRIIRKDGETRWVNVYSSLVDYLGEKATLTTFVDIDERKKAEDARARLEIQLLQAQKMESVGRLAGGIAHDFNNLLMGIMNYAELSRKNIESNHPSRKWLDEITRQSERSASLTQQLLAFARRQTVGPEVLCLNDAINKMLSMLRRLIGENIDLIWRPGGELGPVKIDPSQFDQIVTNLCVNARDAISDVGSVIIETENVVIDEGSCTEYAEAVPGEYVLLAISDNGQGMDSETMGHVFEPFFTTKDVGEGTGLGLATVYGIVGQNGGFVNVYSEPGHGTTFRIYLPQVDDEPAGADEDREEPVHCLEGTETILLVEDERSIRETLCLLLEHLGYTVLSAESPEISLQVASDHQGTIDLLITDVIMPGMNGRELSKKLLQDQSSMKVLYMSGYTADVIAHRGILDKGINFLSKPISSDDLAQTVRQLLDAH